MDALRLKTLAILLTLFLVGSSCARVDSRRFEPGRTTTTQLRSSLGPPLRELVVSTPEAERSHWIYPDGVNFQLEGSRLTARNRPPESSERTLQYWRLRWRGRVQYGGHAELVDSLSCPDERTVVFFRPSDGQVIQVTEYAAR